MRVLDHASEEPLAEVVEPTDKDVRISALLSAENSHVNFFQVEAKIKILRKGGLVDPKRWIDRGNQFLHQKNFESVGQPHLSTNFFLVCIVILCIFH